MAEYSRIATGNVVSTGGQTAVILPFTPTKIEIFNRNRAQAQNGTTTSTLCISRAGWNFDMGQGAASYVQTMTAANGGDITGFIPAGPQTYNIVPSAFNNINGTGFTTVQAALALQYGPTIFLGSGGGITQNAGAPVITTTAPHGLTTGNIVVFQNLYQSSSTGMQQIAGIPFLVTVLSTTTFSISWDNSGGNYVAITTGGLNTKASFKQILYPVLYAPGTAVISALTLSSTTTVTTTAPHNFKLGQEVAFRIPSVWGPSQLNSLPNPIIPGSPIYGYVVSVTNSTNFVVNINSTAYTAFNPNQVFASFSGEQFPQVVAVGDVNTGGTLISSGSSLYPSPLVFNGYTSSTSTGVNTINGPAILGAYINATWQGFIIGSSISGTAADVIDYTAILSDINY